MLQVMAKFMVVSKQAAELDKDMIRMEMKIWDMEKEASHKSKERRKLEDEVKDLKNLVKELKADIVKKETRLDHL